MSKWRARRKGEEGGEGEEGEGRSTLCDVGPSACWYT